ncbi:Zinc/iron permease [Phycomyces blakesleeanus]|uniref:Zinc/iron permease n=2 Tax=Phycomyces blakesleeanus TaxID=4837 RepID=A0A162ZMU3_PHYB8|nr:hypothetical protein PHYBLDRAFT_173822 [Phycomyces blakesleeanus NRRL 1555(-)]OAD67911.1 hypothetical protein PHYBLDRAFT_173822 [Phycomyces blakesleeanus NRRL 1555(-)]|eukprot:XP_018285951.1 hypothetical protein PHYBLDRAFT_173822 [Phycomyces blakesleeanus NRRL 1555(-)]
MLNPFVWLTLLSLSMLVGSFLAGSVPLSTKLSEAKLRYLTALGVGLLLGSALVVIIPEGIETLYDSQRHLSSDSHSKRQEHDEASHAAVGITLVLGFAMMFLIDQVSSLHVHASHPSDEYNELDTIPDSTDPSNTNSNLSAQTRSMTPTIGLIVHAAADGIALGASATHPTLSMVVFVAIMLHKAPAAFALTTVLLGDGLSRDKVRKHLLIFSLAAPVGALTTYLALLVLPTNATPGNLDYWTGILLLFSGGTFLYVAMHALQELQPSASAHCRPSDKLGRTHMATVLAGMLLPIFLNINHAH